MLTPSTLSLAALALGKHIDQHTDLKEANVLVGHPAHVKPADSSQSVSVYFFRVYAAGNSGAMDPSSPLDTIAHCLITSLATPVDSTGTGSDDISAGQNDLAILGQIMRCMHEEPILTVRDASKNTICRVEITPLELTVDELNKIVPTAPELVGFRPSVAYALTLLPIQSRKNPPAGPPVQIVNWGVDASGVPGAEPFPQCVFNGLAAPAGEALPVVDPQQPHMELEDPQGRRTYVTRISPDAATEKIRITIRVPAVEAAGHEVKVTDHRWDPEQIDYVSVKEEPALPIEKFGNVWQASTDWEFDSSVPGQHLMRVERNVGDEIYKGNICMVMIGARGGSP